MHTMLFRVLVLSCCLSLGYAAIPAHEIHSLPGYVDKAGKPKTLPSRHWSGYIEVKIAANGTTPAGSAFVHYWLVENPAKKPDAPTVVWQQGGPGGSSLIGLFTELGPLTLNDASYEDGNYNKSGVPTVFDNPFSWHNAGANYLFVEHPAPTGALCLCAAACRRCWCWW